jgi:putative NIF3 family GTP cyclohydrolase 1 type 2
MLGLMHPSSSRRSFLLAGAALAAAQTTFTADQVIQRIKTNVGIPWRTQTVDNIIAGSLDMPVKGIATTMMATLDVLQRAAAAGRNMVITHEPTFFTHQDRTDTLKNDAVYQYKLDFLTKHEMIVFHFHDHWHGRKPDGIATGMMRALDWEKQADPAADRQFVFPGIPLRRFAHQIREKLKIRVMRVVGEPDMPIRRVAASWGNVGLFPGIPLLSQPGVDALVLGETHEWELVEYVQDMISTGQKKALIILGHVMSEQAGMKYCAEWMRGFISEVPVDFIAAAEPYWMR